MTAPPRTAAATADSVHSPEPAGRRLPRPGGAVVIGGDYRGLGVARSLGRHGIPVWVLTDEHKLGAASRYARRSLPFPSGPEDAQRDYLISLAREHGLAGWALFPTGDETAALIARHEAVLAQHFTITTPNWETMQWAYDKRQTQQLADRLGIGYPRTWYPVSRDEVIAGSWTFPIIIKPAVKVDLNQLTVAKAWRVDDPATLLRLYDEACAIVPPEWVMLQDIIPGDGRDQLSYSALCQGGEVVASIMVRRTRQYPMDFGRASTYVESIEDPELERQSRWLLRHIGYTGLVEVEYKRDPRSGDLCLLDINARVWGWHSIGRRAGVDFPYLLWQAINGEKLQPRRARVGVRWVRGSTDLPTVVKEIRGGRLAARDYLRSLRGPIEHAIFAPDDPLPAVVEIPLIAQLIWKRRSM